MGLGNPVGVRGVARGDVQWSTSSPATYSDVNIGLDAQGKIVGIQLDHYAPPMQDDRPLGAVLAGLPTMDPPGLKPQFGGWRTMSNALLDPWVYGRVPNFAEFGHGTFQPGEKASPIAVGLRSHTMRTPGQLQQNFPRELAMSEAAALVGVDAIEFRITHTTDERLI